jgi:hypothetical protein
MPPARDPLTLFVDCARRAAFLHCLPDALRKNTGVLLELNRSQFARDGLEAASRAFNGLVETRRLSDSEAARLAMSAASDAPVRVWWRPVYLTSEPAHLDRGDVWLSLDEVRAIAAATPALHADRTQEISGQVEVGLPDLRTASSAGRRARHCVSPWRPQRANASPRTRLSAIPPASCDTTIDPGHYPWPAPRVGRGLIRVRSLRSRARQQGSPNFQVAT